VNRQWLADRIFVRNFFAFCERVGQAGAVHDTPDAGEAMPLFRLRLEKTYYRSGFFNVPREFDRFVRSTDGPIELILGASGLKIEGKINRRANLNGTARIMGGSKLRDWFQANYKPGDQIDVDLGSFDSIGIGTAPSEGPGVEGRAAIQPTPKPHAVSQPPENEVTADDLTRWRSALVRLLKAIDPVQEQQEGVGALINRLSRSGRIPREIAALMRAVAEMRNASEYQGKQPSRSEGAAIKNAWAAVFEWARSTGIAIDAKR